MYCTTEDFAQVLKGNIMAYVISTYNYRLVCFKYISFFINIIEGRLKNKITKILNTILIRNVNYFINE